MFLQLWFLDLVNRAKEMQSKVYDFENYKYCMGYSDEFTKKEEKTMFTKVWEDLTLVLHTSTKVKEDYMGYVSVRTRWMIEEFSCQ